MDDCASLEVELEVIITKVLSKIWWVSFNRTAVLQEERPNMIVRVCHDVRDGSLSGRGSPLGPVPDLVPSVLVEPFWAIGDLLQDLQELEDL